MAQNLLKNAELVKDSLRQIRAERYEKLKKEKFNSKKKAMYVQYKKEEKDVIKNDYVIMGGYLFTEKIDDINREMDFFEVTQTKEGNKLSLYTDEDDASKLFDIPLFDLPKLNLNGKKVEPKSIYDLKRKTKNVEMISTIKYLIKYICEQNVDPTISLKLIEIEDTVELIEFINSVLEQAPPFERAYNRKAEFALGTLYSLLCESIRQ